MSLFAEFKRRKVFQVAAVYAVVAWLVIQVIDVIGEPLSLPGWLDTVVIVLLGVGFPVALVLAWAFDITPDGIRPDTGAAPVPAPSLGNRFGALSQVLVLLAVGFLVVDQYLLDRGGMAPVAVRKTADGPRVERFHIEIPDGEVLGIDNRSLSIAVSRDGSKIAFATRAGNNQYAWYVRDIDDLRPRPLRGTNYRFETPFFSPDGAWIGFNDLSDGTIKRLPADGGIAETVTPLATMSGDSALRGARWGEDGRILFGTEERGIWVVAADVGEARQVTDPDIGIQHRWPEWLPGQQAVLFTVLQDGFARIDALDMESGEVNTVVPQGTMPRYLEPGYLLSATEAGALRVVRFDADTRSVIGEPVDVLEQVPVIASGGAHYALADDGTLVVASGLPMLDIGGYTGFRAVWVNLDGSDEPVGMEDCRCIDPVLSPDGTQLAFALDDGSATDVWVWSFERDALSRLTFEAGSDRGPIWSPDSSRIAYRGSDGIYMRNANGTGTPTLLTRHADGSPFAWTDDDRLMYVGRGRDRSRNLYVLPIDEPDEAVPLLDPSVETGRAALSPDGRWLAYESSESGRYEIYVRPYPDLDTGKWQVSTDSGVEPRWSRDGETLFFRSDDRMMMVRIGPGESFSVGRPVALFDTDAYQPNGIRTYDVATDGRFLMMKNADFEMYEAAAAGNADRGRLVVVQNFDLLVREALPAP